MRKTLSATLLVAALWGSGVAAQAPFFQVDGVRQGDTLNVRSGPGANFQDIGDLAPGQVVRVLGYNANGKWAQVRYRGQNAWVSARFLKVTQGGTSGSGTLGTFFVKGIKANDADGGLVVRAGAGKGFARLGVLSNGTGVNVVQRSPGGKWAMINFGNGVGWVSTAYLGQQKPKPAPSQNSLVAPDGGPLPAIFEVTGVSAGDRLNFRDAPRASGNLLGRFPPGARIEVLSMGTPKWAYVTNGEVAGYVHVRYLTRASAGGNTGQGGVSGTSTPNGFPLGIVCQGTEPFWSFEIREDRSVHYNQLAGGVQPPASLVQTTPSAGGSFPYQFAATPYSGVLRLEQCSDGMSDIVYPMSVLISDPTLAGGYPTLNGCCQVQD